MANQAYHVSAADGLGVSSVTGTALVTGDSGTRPGHKRLALGQSTNVPGTQTAQTSASDTGGGNLSCVALPQQAGAGVYSVTVSNSLITANSFVFVSVQDQNADATAGLIVQAWEGSNAARVPGTSFVIKYSCSAAMGAAWVANYEIIN